MSKYIKFKEADPNSEEATHLLDKLSGTLESITGNSGRSSFNPNDINGHRATFVLAYNENEEPVGCGAIRQIVEETAEVKRMYAKVKGNIKVMHP